MPSGSRRHRGSFLHCKAGEGGITGPNMNRIKDRVSGLFKRFSDDDMVILNVVVYIIVAVLLYFVIRAEYLDVYCPTQCWTDECGEGMGMAYAGSKPEAEDTPRTSLDKILIGAKFDTRTVKWRRCFIISVLITLCIFVLILGRLPNGIELALSLIIINLLLNGIFSFYSFHHIQNVSQFVEGNVKNLEEALENAPRRRP